MGRVIDRTWGKEDRPCLGTSRETRLVGGVMLLSKMQLSPIGAHLWPGRGQPTHFLEPIFHLAFQNGAADSKAELCLCFGGSGNQQPVLIACLFSGNRHYRGGQPQTTKKTDLPPPAPTQPTEAGQFLSLRSPFCHPISDS